VDEHLLSIYRSELQTQCEFVVIGAQLVNANLGEGGSTMGVWLIGA